MENIIKKIALGMVILGSLTSCIAYSDGYANNDQGSYYSGNYDNGYYYAPNSYYGNGGYYANDGYYYRDNINYQYDNNVPYYYGQDQRKIYVQRATVATRPPNGLYDPNTATARNRPQANSTPNLRYRNDVQQNSSRNNVRNTQPPATRVQTRSQRSGDGFRNEQMPAAAQRQQNNNYAPRENSSQNQNRNGGGFRSTPTPQPAQTPTRVETDRGGMR